jgi:hypothetical protein
LTSTRLASISVACRTRTLRQRALYYLNSSPNTCVFTFCRLMDLIGGSMEDGDAPHIGQLSLGLQRRFRAQGTGVSHQAHIGFMSVPYRYALRPKPRVTYCPTWDESSRVRWSSPGVCDHASSQVISPISYIAVQRELKPSTVIHIFKTTCLQ